MMRLFLIYLIGISGFAAADEMSHKSQYAGWQDREIKTFSAEDLRQLRAGEGWGLSLVAELNGVPGPKHLLEMRDELKLDQNQLEEINKIFDRMKAEAKRLGEQMIELEKRLDTNFASGTLDDNTLREILDAIAKTRNSLRYTHLSAHLSTPPLLSQAQVAEYKRLRGYGSIDPCQSVPDGHDPQMWKQHNRCAEIEPASSQSDCVTVQGADVLTAGGVVLLGEIHGTNEAPRFVESLACNALAGGLDVVIALELPQSEESSVRQFIRAKPGNRSKITELPFWSRDYQDGRTVQFHRRR